MAISDETLKAMVRDYSGFELSDEELKRIRPELEKYEEAMEALRQVDVSDVKSARLLRAQEGGEV